MQFVEGIRNVGKAFNGFLSTLSQETGVLELVTTTGGKSKNGEYIYNS